MTLNRLVVATGNRGKIREISSLLARLPVEVVPVGSLVAGFDPEETGATFLENARLKAMAAFHATGLPSLADDSGLCVVGLGLEPGVRSSRYAGEGKSDADRVRFLLSRMEKLTGAERAAWFACTLYGVIPAAWVPGVASAGPDPASTGVSLEPGPPGFLGVVCVGRLPGQIGFDPRGTDGFGYDPVFHPDDDPTRTLAQYGLDEKNRISHRGIAFRTFSDWLSRNSPGSY